MESKAKSGKFGDKYAGTALITGASSGIGEAFAYRLVSENLPLLLVARRAAKLDALKQDIESRYGVKVVTQPADLATPEGLTATIVAAKALATPVSVLVNNAGFGSFGEFHTGSTAEYTEMIHLNCVAPTVLAATLIPTMLNGEQRGAIIFLASVLAHIPSPGFATYSATKGYNLLLGNSLWAELKNKGVDVLTVSPGYTITEFHSRAKSPSPGRVGLGTRTPDDVVATVMRHLGHGPHKVDGFMNSVITAIASRLLPISFMAKLVSKAMPAQDNQK